MTEVVVRKSGGAAIVSIPKAISELAGIKVGSTLELSLEDHTILLRPKKNELTLEELIAGSPKEKMAHTDEDIEWIGERPVGREEI